MVKKMKTYLLLGAVLILTLAANISAALACASLHFQPDVPKDLADKYC